jgi:peptidoglycan/LPS O-acetylase OafA/YrhL
MCKLFMRTPLSPLLWGLCFFALVNVVVRKEQSNTSFISNRFSKWITSAGVFSYSLYLVHHPVRAVVKGLMGRCIHVETQNPVLYLVYAAIMGIAGYFTARLFFRVVESRFLNTSSETTLTL